MLYFDHNSTAPLHPAARAAWLDMQERFPANPASAHRLGQRAEVALETAREHLASLLACPPASLVWTSGATEAANTALAHLAAVSSASAPVWVSAIEHPCVLEAASRWFPGRVRLLPVTSGGVLDLAVFQAALGNTSPAAGDLAAAVPAAVVLMAANNETGVLQPWRAVRELCRERAVPFVCDATQWLGRLPADGLGECDFVFGSGHKCGAPVGIGFLKAPDACRPLLAGGPQEGGRRAGTQNLAGAAALVAALRACAESLAGVPDRVALRSAHEAALLSTLPGAEILGAGTERLWNTIALLAPPLSDCRQRWVVRLDAAGVAASSGSACASGKEAPSHVLAAMGVPPGSSDRVLRLSGGWETGADDWRAVVEMLRGIFERWR